MNRILLNPYQNIDITGKYISGLQQGLDISKQRRDISAQDEANARYNQAIGLTSNFYNKTPEEQLGLISQIQPLSPEISKGLLDVYNSQQYYKQAKEQAESEYKQAENQIVSRMANSVLTADDTQKPEIYKANIKLANQKGIDTSMLPQEYSPEIEPFLQAIVSQASGITVPTEEKAYTPMSSAGKIEQDYNMGIISKETRDRLLEQEYGTTTGKAGAGGFAEDKFEEEIGKQSAKRLSENTDFINKTRDQIAKLGELKSAASDPDAYLGAGAEKIQNLKTLLSSFGFANVKGEDSEAIFTSLANELAKQARVAGEGSLSDADLKFLRESVPRKNLTKEQNIALIEILEKKYYRQLEITAFENDFIEKNRTIVGLNKAKDKFIKENDLFSKDDKEKYINIFGEKKQEVSKQGTKYEEGDIATSPEGIDYIYRNNKWVRI